jgi:hypothetical protein
MGKYTGNSVEQASNILEVGQKVFYLHIGYRRNERNDSQLYEATVSKIGRKWFEVEELSFTRFSLEDLRNDGKGFTSSYRIVLSKEDFELEQEHYKLRGKVEDFFRYGANKATLQQLKDIAKVLNIEPTVQASVASKDDSSNSSD